MGRVTNNNLINKPISFSENTIKAAQKTLITLIAAVALAAALTGTYLLVQHNYTLLSFENTIGLTVAGSFVTFASALTLFFNNRERIQKAKATTPPAAKPLPKPTAASSQPAGATLTFKLPSLNPHNSPLKCLNPTEQRHLAKTLGADEYCEIISDLGNELAILEKDRFFLVDSEGKVTAIRMNNKAETELPLDPALADYNAVRKLLKGKKDVSSEVRQRVKDFPKRISNADADSLPKFLKPGEYTTFTFPKDEKRVVCCSDLIGLQFKKFADNGETEDQLYTGEKDKVFEGDTFTTYLISLRTFKVKFVPIDELIARKADAELSSVAPPQDPAPLQAAPSPLLNPKYHVQSLFYPEGHLLFLPNSAPFFMMISEEEKATFTNRLRNNEFFCCEVDRRQFVITRDHEGTLETFTEPQRPMN